MWPGYIVTVRPTAGWKLMLNIDVSATGFYRDISVLDFISEIVQRFNPNQELHDRDRKLFEKEIKGYL